MKRYEFDIADDIPVNMAGLIAYNFHLLVKVKRERPSGHPVIQVIVENEEDLESLKRWYSVYYETGEPLHFYEV